jgi:hypothetical protein
MEIADGQQKDFDHWVHVNSGNGYSKACVGFAVAWADEMERAMSDGKPVEAVARPAAGVADKKFGVTGFMYGCAVAGLSKFWKYGEALRRWHNLDTQIGNEGEEANEKGTVLNPAWLSVG